MEKILYVLGPAVAIIALLMEAYKTRIRKGKARDWENLVLSVSLSVILAYAGATGFDLPGHDFALVYYSLGVFGLQFFVDMAVLKKIVKAYAKREGKDPWRIYNG